MRKALPVIGMLLLLVFFYCDGAAATECQLCHKFFDDEWCEPVGAGESGNTNCSSPEEASCCCRFSGSPCSGSGGSGGGGGGGWGGGGGACSGSGFCPAECFSCGGGGSL